ncbi:MAG: hypothetical protein Q8S33_20710 [Myxococcales bacterium]|nr:hypothetical protein [Myxococcales bacterium]MDP3502768.1 hypothetical protein [Myxococcales bacterium]
MNESPSPVVRESAPIPVFRISFANATLLSAGYLVVGAIVELVRRTWNPRWAEQLSWSMEAFPAGILRTFGALDPLREAYAAGTLHETHVRLIYAGAVVLTVYGIGLLVGASMWLMVRSRRSAG